MRQSLEAKGEVGGKPFELHLRRSQIPEQDEPHLVDRGKFREIREADTGALGEDAARHLGALRIEPAGQPAAEPFDCRVESNAEDLRYLPGGEESRVRAAHRSSLRILETALLRCTYSSGREHALDVVTPPITRYRGWRRHLVAVLAGDRVAERRDLADFERFLGETSRRLLASTPEAFPALAEELLREVTAWFATDRATLQRLEGDQLRVRFAWGRPELHEPRPATDVTGPFDWLIRELRAGRSVVLRDLPGDLPPEARAERSYVERVGMRAHLTLPLTVSGRFLWSMSTADFGGPRDWTAKDIARLRYLGDTLAAAAERVELELAAAARLAEVEELRRQLKAEARYLRAELTEGLGGDEVVGRSTPILQTLALVDRVAPTPSTVLLLGETGTGKELLARAVHARSPRRGGPMVKINCAAVPASLVESELFGHEKGAFTGATAARPGRFQIAAGGTLFLDEIGDLPEEVQIKLLRVLQEREFQPVGSNRTLRADVRVIAATHRDLEAEVRAGRFRSDLYFRLNVFPIRVPALRERRGDIPLLVWALVERLQGAVGKKIRRVLDSDLATLAAYAWPGNVRELQNVVERALILSPGETLAIAEAFHLAGAGAEPATTTTATATPEGASPQRLDEIERRHIAEVVQRSGGKIAGAGGAAEQLGLHPNTLRSRMQKLGILRPRR